MRRINLHFGSATARALLATTAMFGVAMPALAQSAPEFGRFVSETDPDLLTVAAGETTTGAQSGVFSRRHGLALNNAGTIRGDGTRDDLNSVPAAGVSIDEGDHVITNSGTISGAGLGITTLYYLNGTGQLEPRAVNTRITNSGVIRGESNDGIRLIGGGTVANSGGIEGSGSPFADGISMFFLDGQDVAGRTSVGTVTNAAAGTVTGDRFGVILSGGGIIDNAGRITGDAAGVQVQSQASNGTTGTAAITNSGTITGGDGVRLAGTLAEGSLTNSGAITGAGEYGVVSGVSGLVTIDNAVAGNITGAQSGILSEGGALTINNAGTIRGNGTRDDLVSVPAAGISIAVGDNVVNNSGTISGAGGGVTTLYYFNPDTGLLEARATNTVVANSGTISGEGNDGVRLIGGGTITNSGAIEGAGAAFADGISMFYLDGQDITGRTGVGTVTNASGGHITGERYGVILFGGGTVENAGLIEGGVAGLAIVDQGRTGTVGSLTNSGEIVGGVLMDVDTGNAVNSGTITSADGAAFTSIQAITLTNSGTIAGGGDIAVQLSDGDDTLVLMTGSNIEGTVDGGAGSDIANLVGTADARTATQVVADLQAFETISVDDGYWVAGIDGFAVADVRIASGATLEALQTAPGGETAVEIAVANEGTLVLNVGADDDPLMLDSLSVTGTGAVRLTGAGIVVQDGAGLQHGGGTFVESGTLAVTGTLGGTVTTTGAGTFQIGTGGVEGDFAGDLINNGSFVFDRSDDYLFGGAFSGTGAFEKRGGGTLTFGGLYAFEGVTTVTGGKIAFTGTIDPETEIDLKDAIFDVSAAPQTIGMLAGNGDSSVVIGGSTLTIDQDSNTEYAGGLEGDGELILAGEGRLNLTGNSSFSGTTRVQGGTLAVNGTLTNSDIVVGVGGALGGNGIVGSTTVGGTLTPGNSVGRLTVNGNLTFTAASVFTIEADATGAADRVDATGIATLGGATVEVIAANGQYRASTDYTILTAAGGISGQFGTVTSNLAFLTPSLRYSANQVTLRLLRNDIDFADVATSANQVSVAGALQSLDTAGALFNAVLFASAADARAAYDILSGEALASFGSAIINDGRHVRRALNASAPKKDGANGLFAWGDVVGSWGSADDAGLAQLDSDYTGYAGGIGYAAANGYVSVGVGRGDADYRVGGGAEAANDGWFVGGEAGYRAGALGLKAGLACAWHEIATDRPLATLGLTGRGTAAFDANSFQIYGEASFDMTHGPIGVAPFAGIAHLSTSMEGFAETGGAGALTVAESDRKVTFGEIGLRASGRLPAKGLTITPDLEVAWQHAWGDRDGRSTQRFSVGGDSFSVAGTRIAEDAARIDVGVELGTQRFGFRIGYSGQIAGSWSDHAARATVRLNF